MAQAITDELFGAWVLKCNPQTWDLEGFQADGKSSIEDWSVQNNYRSARMWPGDPVVFWVTGSADADVPPGVWGVGYVTAPVNIAVDIVDDETFDDQGQLGDDESELGYWLDLDVQARARFFVQVDLPLLPVPLVRDCIQSDPVLANMELLRQPQMSNPSWLTSDEWRALRQLLGENVPEPLHPADLAEWNRQAEVQQPDPATRRIIEIVAVAEVSDHLESEGWQVHDVQDDNVGWDLTASQDGVVRCIEVKGRAPSRLIVQLTANEVRAAHEIAGWKLAVVTDTLTSPKISWHSAQTVTAAAKPITYRAELG